MKHFKVRILAVALVLAMLLGACGPAAKNETLTREAQSESRETGSTKPGKETKSETAGETGSGAVTAPETQTETETEPVTTEAETTEPETEPPRPDIHSWQIGWKRNLAEVIREKQAESGRTCFVLDNISRVFGMGIVHAKDLDGDGQEELVFVYPQLKEGGYYDYRMQIWKGTLLSAECLYDGICYRMGVDNRGMQFWEDEKGDVYFLYDDEETMNGRYLGRIVKGRFEEVCTLDWSQMSYDNEAQQYVYEGKRYTPDETLTTYCYNWGEENDDYYNWTDVIKGSYIDALKTVGLIKEDGADIYTPGLASLHGDEYLRVRVTHVDADGSISAVWEYDFDEEGREVRSYRNDIMRTEKIYNDKGYLAHEISYTMKGIKSEEEIYDDNGNLLEKMTYNSDGRVNWDFVYTYDEKDRMATATTGIGYIKEYEYNDDDVMTEVRTVDEKTGEIETTHRFVLDEQGRPVEDWLDRDGMHLKYQTWEYNADGSHTEILWDYQAYDKNADKYYLEGREVPGTVTEYDAEGRVLCQTIYTFLDYGTTEQAVYTIEETTYDEKGAVLTNVKKTHNKGVLSYEERTESEYTKDGLLKHREITYHGYGYWENLGEKEREVSFTNYEAEFNELGYRIRVVTRKNDDPYGSGEDYQSDEMYILYENAYGEIMGIADFN